MEESPSGSRIFRHRPRDDELEPAFGDEKLIESLTNHIEAHFGAEPIVLHEVVSDLVHIDVHVVPPTEERAWQTLITSGMAERPMAAPEGFEEYRFAELVLALPAQWPLTTEALDDGPVYWPVGLLKTLARLPHEYGTWLSVGHTIPNGDPPEPYALDTELCCALIMPAVTAPESFEELALEDGRLVNFFGVVPIHADEMEFKLTKGLERLTDLLDENAVSELLDPTRASVIPKRRGLFRS